MATFRERHPGVWEVRVVTGSDARGRTMQVSRTVHGGKRDAQRLAAQLESTGGKASTPSPPPTKQPPPASARS